MPLFDTMTNFLKGPVGNNLDNDPEDVRNTKASLNELGYFDEEIENDFITRTLDTNIKSFQKDNDLKVDGKLYPNGETENSILQNLASSQLLPVAASTYSSQAETRSPAIASFGQVAENVDATGRMIRDQVTSTQTDLPYTPIPSEYPQTSIPEEEPPLASKTEDQKNSNNSEPDQRENASPIDGQYCIDLYHRHKNLQDRISDINEEIYEIDRNIAYAEQDISALKKEYLAEAAKFNSLPTPRKRMKIGLGDFVDVISGADKQDRLAKIQGDIDHQESMIKGYEQRKERLRRESDKTYKELLKVEEERRLNCPDE